MKSNFKTIACSGFFLVIFIIKMTISITPMFLNLDSKVVNAVIMQLELENNGKEGASDSKDFKNFFKKGVDFIHNHNFEIAKTITIDDINYHFVYKKYIKTFFPRVPTPPPNQA